MKHVNRGANWIEYRALKQGDASPLLISDVTSLQVEISQKGEIKKTWVYTPGDGWSDGLSEFDTSTVQLQIDSTLSETFCEGKVDLRWIVKFPNDLFTVDGGNQVDPIPETIAYVD